MNNDAVVVFSGGQDSTTCLYWAKREFERVYALCFSYGQKHVAEVDVARAIAGEAGVPFRVVDLPFIGGLAHNSLTDIGMAMDEDVPVGGVPNTFVPGRNLFFLSVAAVIARELGAANIVTGVSQTDFSGYPDCRDNFIRSLNVTLNLAMESQFVIHTPLMWMDKREFDIVREKTLTCYNGIVGDGCGHCPSCKLRRHGLEEYLKERDAHKAQANGITERR